ncbi:MAG: MarR family transcriptional regulator, partial [Acidimicrobiia bacterium]
LKTLEKSSLRFNRYLPRLEDCIERLLEGDQSALTGVMKESYHTVWFELHEDLMLTLGIARTE